MSTIYSYDLKGNKLSFANWVSNLSPEETPFCSMTKKEKVNQVMFQWQSDRLNPSGTNASIEGNVVTAPTLGPTQTHYNYTQILRKVVKVSDTADSIANYGRENELSYQTMKAGSEIKRDLEWAYLHNEVAIIGDNNTPRETAGFKGLVARKDASDPSTGAVVHKEHFGALSYEELVDMMYNLYLAGSTANIIMYHPKLAPFFSSLQESNQLKSNKVRLFESTNIASFYVDEILSPWCQKFKLIPNRLMPEGHVYFYNPDDFTQMVLREPQRVKLSKSGSSQKTMIEMEMGLRLSNPFAAGVLSPAHRVRREIFDIASKLVNGQDARDASRNISITVGGVLVAAFKLLVGPLRSYEDNTSVNFVVYKDGRVILRKDNVDLGTSGEIVIHNTFSPADAGVYKIVAESKNFYDDSYEFTVVEDTDSVIVCTDGDFMRSVDVDGTTMNSYNKSMTLDKGSSVTFNVRVKDTAYDDCTWLLNKSNNDGTFTTIEMKPVTSDISYTFQNVDSTFNGEYSITIVSGKGCSQTTKTLILDVKDIPSDMGPFKAGSLSVNGWTLQDGINSTVVSVDNGNPIEISYEINPPFAGKDVEIVTSLWGKAVHTRKAILGKDTYTVVLKPSEETTYMFRVVDNDKVHLSPSFTLELTSPAPTPPAVSDIFNPIYSYVGSACLADDSIAISAAIPQFAGKFFAISEYSNQSDPVTYQMFNTADTSIVFDLEIKETGQDVGTYVYKYLGANVKTSDSGEYVLRAVRNGHVQDSKPFTLAFRNI